MELRGLFGAVADAASPLMRWLAAQDASAFVEPAAALGSIFVGLWAFRALDRRWRARSGGDIDALKSEIADLKDLVRLRLCEPAAFAHARECAPTLGALESFGRDIEAAARHVFVDAGGDRASAKLLLRRRLREQATAPDWCALGVLSFIDSTREAIAAYMKAADLEPEDPEIALLLGVLHMNAGHLTPAEGAFRRHLALAARRPDGGPLYRGHCLLADVLAAQGSLDAALAGYREAARELGCLTEREPAHAGWQRDLALCHDRIGDIFLAQRDLDRALESHWRSLTLSEALAKRDCSSLQWQRDISVSYDRIGEVLREKGMLDEALESHRRGLEIAETLAKADPARTEWQWDLSVSHERIGDVLAAKGDLEGALASYRRSLFLAEALARRNPGHTGWQRDLAVSCHRVGLIEAARKNVGEARVLLERGREIIARLVRIASQQAQWQSDLSAFDEALRKLDAGYRAGPVAIGSLGSAPHSAQEPS
jgi:tetratricopeptide (TPR) repeat protein